MRTGLERAVETLTGDGWCVVERAVEAPVIADLETELESCFAATPLCQGAFYGERTKRFGSLLTRAPAIERLVMDPLIGAIVERMLLPWCERIALNLTQAIEIHPNALPQLPHRDQDMWRGPKGSVGCTFAENPAESCAIVLPVWSAAVDPSVISVRAIAAGKDGSHVFDPSRFVSKTIRDGFLEHAVVIYGDAVVRLDVLEGTLSAGPVLLRFDLPDDDHLETRISAIRSLVAKKRRKCRHIQIARLLHALEAMDARNKGASLRDVAELLLGAGDWPGDGEHRKSFVRRLITAGDQMIRAGPQAVLAHGKRRAIFSGAQVRG